MRRGTEAGERSSAPCPALPERAAKAAPQDSACGAIAFRLVWTGIHTLSTSLMESVWTGPHIMRSAHWKTISPWYQTSAEGMTHALIVLIILRAAGAMKETRMVLESVTRVGCQVLFSEDQSQALFPGCCLTVPPALWITRGTSSHARTVSAMVTPPAPALVSVINHASTTHRVIIVRAAVMVSLEILPMGASAASASAMNKELFVFTKLGDVIAPLRVSDSLML